MNSFLFIMLFIFLLSLVLILLGLVLSTKKTKCLKMMSPFECGFHMKFWFRKPFSLHFLSLSLIFLVFDLELILLFPLFSNLNLSISFLNMYMYLAFLLVLTLLLFLEWNQLMLEWMS